MNNSEEYNSRRVCTIYLRAHLVQMHLVLKSTKTKLSFQILLEELVEGVGEIRTYLPEGTKSESNALFHLDMLPILYAA